MKSIVTKNIQNREMNIGESKARGNYVVTMRMKDEVAKISWKRENKEM